MRGDFIIFSVTYSPSPMNAILEQRLTKTSFLRLIKTSHSHGRPFAVFCTANRFHRALSVTFAFTLNEIRASVFTVAAGPLIEAH